MDITVYTDGACSGNPGVGGYAAILQCNGLERVVKGFSSKVTTNCAMELAAVVETIKWLNDKQKKPCNVTVHTDSQYLIDCICGKNKDGSKRKVEWYTGRPNEDLWIELIKNVHKGKHTIKMVKVKGHSGDSMNARVDKLAKEECIRAKHELLKERMK